VGDLEVAAMMRAHCDRCDKLCDEYPYSIADKQVDEQRAKIGAGAELFWHVAVSSGGCITPNITMLCRTCRIAILEAHVRALRLVKAPTGGHLADCRWNDAAKRYACAEGCEIKRINEQLHR
jgi:hypothetical protein